MDDKMDPNSSLHSLHHPRQYLIGRANFYIPLLITRRLGTTKPPDSSTDLKLVLKIISISSSPNKKKKKKKKGIEKKIAIGWLRDAWTEKEGPLWSSKTEGEKIDLCGAPWLAQFGSSSTHSPPSQMISIAPRSPLMESSKKIHTSLSDLPRDVQLMLLSYLSFRELQWY